jgi:hypothetical protein
MTDQPLALVPTHDNTNEYREIPDSSSVSLRRGNIRFTPLEDESGFEVHAWGELFKSTEDGHVGRLQRRPDQLRQDISDCLDEWGRVILGVSPYTGRSGSTMYTEKARPADEPKEELEANELDLARAGHKLFRLLFCNGDEELKVIADLLVDGLTSREQVLAFHSNEVLAPWWALYVPPEGTALRGEGARCDPSGFWGYKHLIEHQFREQGFTRNADRSLIRIPHGDPVIVSANVDPTLDDEHSSCVSTVISFLEQEPGFTVNQRHTKDDLDAGMRGQLTEHVIYFCCHGVIAVSDSGTRVHQLLLKDGKPIRESDFREWLLDRFFDTNPVVFLNTCHGGLMSSQSYTSIGPTLLERKANCIIGPQIGLPKVFAAEYAISLLGQLLQGEPLGTSMRLLTRSYLDDHRNPLGLIFGSYAGLDARLIRHSP